MSEGEKITFIESEGGEGELRMRDGGCSLFLSGRV